MVNDTHGEPQAVEILKQRGLSGFFRGHQLLADVTVAMLYVIFLLPGLLHSIMFIADAEGAGIGVGATIGAGVALVFRRQAPLMVFAIVLVLLLAIKTFALGYVDPLGIAVAGYSLGAHLPPPQAWVAVSAAIIIVALSIVIGTPLSSVGISASSLLILTLVVFVPLCLVGLIVNFVGELRQAEKLQAVYDMREKTQAAELAASRQRAVLSREIHDVVGHSLTSIINLSDGVLRVSTASPEALDAGLHRINRIARDALGETRTILNTLRPEKDVATRDSLHPSTTLCTPPALGIDRSIQMLLDTVENTGLTTHLHVQGEASTEPITDEIRGTVFRIVQEAVTNTMRHAADATELTVTLTYGAKDMTVQVADNGHSCPDTVAGRGLRGAADRAAELGGKLRYGPAPEGGWYVTANIPTAGGEAPGD